MYENEKIRSARRVLVVEDNETKEYFAMKTETFTQDNVLYATSTMYFMKNENGKFELAWPLRYDKKRLNPILESISGKNKIILC